MCPAITAGPCWPGDGPYLYHPARFRFASGGTASVPSLFSPSSMTGAFTPMAGIMMRTGTDLAPNAVAAPPSARLVLLADGGAVPTEDGMGLTPAGGEPHATASSTRPARTR